MSQLQAHYDSISAPVQVLVIDILESMATTKTIQQTYNIYPPCLNDQPGTVWNLYHFDNYIPSNFVIQRDADQTLFYRAHTMTKANMIYWIDQALAVAVEETPSTGEYTSLKTSNVSNNCINIEYTLKNTANIKLDVYDATGRSIKRLTEGIRNSGNYVTSYQPKKNGIYFVKLAVDRKVFTNKVVILK